MFNFSHYFVFIILLIKLHTVLFGTILKYCMDNSIYFGAEFMITLYKCDSRTLLCFPLIVYLFLSILLFWNPLIVVLPSTATTALHYSLHSFLLHRLLLPEAESMIHYAIVSINSFSTNSHFAGFHSFNLPQTGNDHNP